ncbi:two-component system phosphate regulon response regulator PhoB [Phyllobacterium myrsinacearum]|uniref:winged helix-turn-helix transcriptional regulator n=1 Tax=Phyllobacterium myrsinacearum TaxID=28101 RepID=UPI0010294330|nr:response regulator transcription factor [Phyllobacterium myrsinacearum]RZS70608.1 two-component system phosphate regulon response regulator PhoB [Phyllobacterium myrsinacearum]
MAAKPVIAICSDDTELCLLLRHIVEAEGYASVLASSPAEMLAVLENEMPQAIVADTACEGCGLSALTRQIKSRSSGTVIPMAALIRADRSRELMRVPSGSMDEGFLRPLIPDRLLRFLARTVSAARAPRSEEQVLRQGDVAINVPGHVATCNGRRLDLPPIEFRLLCHLLRYPDRVHSRQALIPVLWDDAARVNPRSVDIHVSRLRRILRDGNTGTPIKTVRACGYIFDTCGL